ncbi:MAG: hypothetical protein V4644_00085 [Patescibacteria group bacterium]
MNPTTKKVLGIILCVLVGAVLGYGFARAVDKKEDFDRMIEARDAAPDKEAFDRNFEAMGQWFEEYKRDNPGATDADAERAYTELWSQ